MQTYVGNYSIRLYQLQTSYLIHYTSSYSQTTPINPHSLATPIGPHNSARLATTHWLTTNSLTIRYNIAILNNYVCKCGCRLYPPVLSTQLVCNGVQYPKHHHHFPSRRTLGCFSWQPTTLCNMQAILHCIPP